MSSREDILAKLSSKTGSFDSKNEDHSSLHVVPNVPDNPEEMLARFIEEAKKLDCEIHQVEDEKDAIEEILTLIEGKTEILGWAFKNIPLPNLEAVFKEKGIHLDESANPNLRYGITGAEAALAGTGSIVLASGAGKSRAASLLPQIHIAVLHSHQIIQDLESWVAQKPDLHEASNVFLVSGPSKTADIAMELVLGMHGPQEVHLVLIGEK